MGNYLPRFSSFISFDNNSRKRKMVERSGEESEVGAPERKRFRLDNCVVSKLPNNEQQPDVVLLAFGSRWPCNRKILSQSEFFATLFNGRFKESFLEEVKIETNDDLIDQKSFHKLIDLMYDREVALTEDDLFSMTVTARYFQMEEIVSFCEDKIYNTIKSFNAIDLYRFADRYYLTKVRHRSFQWMLLRLFPVEKWEKLKHLSLDLIEKLISHPRLVTSSEMYLYLVLRMMIQIKLAGTWESPNEGFYSTIRENQTPFLETSDGEQFRKAFNALRLGNIIVKRENVEFLLRDNIIPRSEIDKCVYINWMSIISVERPDNFGPALSIVNKKDFEAHAMRFSKIIEQPNFHTWKFSGFSFAFDLLLFFDGRTLIAKRVHQINEHKVSHSHLLRRIMIRFEIFEMDSCTLTRQQSISSLTFSTNEEIRLKQLRREPKYPCRISVEVLYHVPYKVDDENEKTHNSITGYELVEQGEVSCGSSSLANMKIKTLKSCKKFFNLPS